MPALFPLRLPRAAGSLLGLAVFLLALIAAERLCLAVPRGGSRAAAVWLPNALVLTVLLRRSTREWPAWLALFVGVGVGAAVSIGVPPRLSVILHVINVGEILAVALVLRRWASAVSDEDRLRHLLRFAGAAVVASLGSGVAAAIVISGLERQEFLSQLRTWTLAHASGLLVLTPCLTALSRSRELLRERRPTPRAGLALLLVAATAVAVFAQAQAPVLFLIPPTLIWLTLELEVLGAAVGVLTVAALGLAFMLAGNGPVTLVRDPLQRAAVFQLFVVVCMAGTLPVAYLTARRRRLTASLKQARDAAEAGERAAAESEARFRRLSDHASDVISSVRAGGPFQYVSPSITTVAGWAPEELVGRTPRDFVHPDDMAALSAAFAALGTGAAPVDRSLEYRFRRKNGDWVWIQSNPQMVRDEGGGLAYIDVARDVTERRALEVELREARAEAERLAAAKAEFLADMSHELRTPLTAVLGYASLLAMQPELTEASRGHLARVRNAGQALLATINDVLDFSKLEAGQVDANPVPVEPARLARTTLELFALQAEAKGLQLSLEGAEALPASVRLDPDRVRQVLINLVGNAVKFTERGAVTVRVSHDGARLLAEVEDTGTGIGAEDLAALFKRFSQVGEGGAHRHGGSGLGLAICKGLVEAMGGAVSVRSTPGRGSVFGFHVPATVEVAAQVRPGAGAPAAAHTGSCGRSVLVADDNAANRDIARTLLRAIGFEVAEAHDGAEALAAASRQAFDVILLDLRMPRMDGAAVARAIRAGGGPNAATPLLAFSAEPAGADPQLWSGVISKPIAFDVLTAAVSGAATNSKARGSQAA